MTDLSPLISEIKGRHHSRRVLLRVYLGLANQVRALCWRICADDLKRDDPEISWGDLKKKATPRARALLENVKRAYRLGKPIEDQLGLIVGVTALPLLDAMEIVHRHRLSIEKRMAELAGELPVFPWWGAIHGCGAPGLAQIVGEAGDLSRYSNPAKLWKRMGVGGVNTAQGFVPQRKTKDAELAIAMGYAQERRSVLHVIGDSLMRQQNAYRDLYLARKEQERGKAAIEGRTVLPSSKITKANRETSRSEGHVHKRALRYMEKRLLRDLWRAWREAILVPSTSSSTPPTPAT